MWVFLGLFHTRMSRRQRSLRDMLKRISRFLKKLGDANKTRFGEGRMDCCALNTPTSKGAGVSQHVEPVSTETHRNGPEKRPGR